MPPKPKPAYAVEAWFTGELGVGPQCSANGEYCWLCANCDTGAEGDPVSDMKTVVRKMAGKKELCTIVDTVKEIYDTHIRESTVGTGPTGAVLDKPEWSRKSITAHLVYSTEFPELFQSVVTQIYQSTIMQLNTRVLVNGQIDPQAAAELRKMTAALKQWQSK